MAGANNAEQQRMIDRIKCITFCEARDVATINCDHANQNNCRETTEWSTNGIPIVGSDKKFGYDAFHLGSPFGLFVDDERGNIYVADTHNHRVQKFNLKAIGSGGITVAGGNGAGNGSNQLNMPWVVYVDKNENVYVGDTDNSRIQMWAKGATSGVTVAGGRGKGKNLNQIGACQGIFVHEETNTLFISDFYNDRIVKWIPEKDEGVIVAGTGVGGSSANQLSGPRGIFIDQCETIYIADLWNSRIQKWEKGATEGITVAGGNGKGSATNQLYDPWDVEVDQYGNVYVADTSNNRIMKWAPGATSVINSTTTSTIPITTASAAIILTTSAAIISTTSATTIQQLVIPNIPVNARWAQQGVTVAGGHQSGNATNQFFYPKGLFIDDDDQTMIIADTLNHRIIQWKTGDVNGQVAAGGHGRGNRLDQLSWPIAVVIDKDTDSIIICDDNNQRVVRWSRRNDTSQGEILLDNINCFGLAMDNQKYLYISDTRNHEVRRYRIGDKNGTLVAGGHGEGNGLNQFNGPTYIFIDQQHTVYVTDRNNHRVMKWDKYATEGIVVAGGQGKVNALTQLSFPYQLFVDTLGTLYVADSANHRVMRWFKDAKQGTVIAGGNGPGERVHQLHYPYGLFFDRHGNLYVTDSENHRIQRFSIA
ncbi:unnamed protein product [Rotaria sp. Silwood1]|nr:unnamed protein product [Rotaria sp. Silwood1]CAF4632862.1 unnamed protein product [Rotaria sp. Silwood1]